MTRKLTFLLTALMLIMGIGVSWADNYTITFKTGSGDGSNVSTSTLCSAIVTEGSTYLSGNVATATKVYHSGNYGLKLGTSNDPGTLKMNLSSNGKVTPTSIVVRAKRFSSSKPTKLSLNGETAQDLTSDFADYTFNITNEITYLELKSSKGTSGGAYCWIASITVNYIATPSATLESIVVSGTAADLWTADEFSHEGITVMANWDEGDPTDVTSACEYSGYNMTSAGEQTVTVSYTAGEVTKSDTYTVTVNTIGNTQDEPYTVAQAKALIDAGDGLNEEVYVEGIICQVDSYNSAYYSITYWISTDGTTTDKFEVYGGLNAEDQDPFTSKDDLTVGYHAIVKGTIQKFNSTYEFSQNSRLVSYTPPVTQLPTPTNLDASNLSMTGATLSWSAVEHASSYTVYVTGGDDYEETFEPTTNSIVLDGLTAGTAYLWTVKAIGDGVTYLDSEVSALAQFNTPTTVIYNINFETQQTGGTIEIEYEQAAAGEHVYAIATADYHYSFTRWNFSPAVTIYDGEDTDNNIIFIIPDSDVTVSATFTEDTKYTVTYAKGGDDVTGVDPETVWYYEDDVVILEENPYTRTGFTFNGWQVKDAEENDVTVDEGMFEMPASDVTVTATWAGKTQYTVTYRALGAQIGTEQVYDGDLCANVPEVTNTPTGWTFFGWTTGSADNTTTAPEPFDPATDPVIENITLNAVFTKTEGETSWDETELADLTSSDVFVMVGTNNKLLQNNNKTAVSATIEDGQVTTAIIDDYKWNVTEEDGSYVFNANGSTNVLYFTNDNNGVKFGTPQSSSESTKYFTQNNNGYLVGTDGTNTRYLSYYSNNNDWRCYKNLDNNPIAMKFYKLNTGTTYYTTVVPASEYAIAIDENIQHGTIEVENALTAAAAETEITLIVTPEEHYSLAANSLTVTGASSATVEVTPVPGEVVKYTFLMPAEAVTITAQFTENPKFAVSCYANGTLVSTEQVYAGEMQLTAPDNNVPNGYTYVGWTTEPITGVAQSATYFSSYNVTENVNLYAVFAIGSAGGITSVTKDIITEAGLTASVTLNADNNPYQMGELPITLTGIKGSSNFPALNYNATNGTDLRFYKGTTCGVTFATTNNSTITKIEFKKNAETASTLGDVFSANVGTLSGNVWTGSAERVTISYSADATFKEQMYIINVTYSETVPSTYSNYCTTVTALSGNVASQTYEGAYYIAATSAGEPAQINGLVTINGALGNADPALLIINDGGQLIHHNAGVAATVKKSITGYTGDNDNYYLIANPTDNTTVANLINPEGYDLYTFKPTQAFEWHYEKGSNTLTSGIGYLYANSRDVILQFAGELMPAGEATIDDLKYYDGNEAGRDFPGFNLIGNPYTCNVYLNKDAYVLNGDDFVSIDAGTAIAPCQGFFVEATQVDKSVTLSTTAPVTVPNALNITVSQNRGNVIDRAIVRFDGANNLHKFMLNPAHTNLSIAKGSETFAAISTEAEGELPVNFKAEKNGTYTITVDTKNVDAEYLHLIDNMTGMDVDLLSTPSYTFEAKTSDYASRFKLVFGVKNEASESSDSNFAFMSNGNLVIDNIEGEATLQIVDELGRVISTETVSGSYNKALNLKAGLYIINLNGMTQKIVVK